MNGLCRVPACRSNDLGDSTELAIAASESLVADYERLPGANHSETLRSRSNLAAAAMEWGGRSRRSCCRWRTCSDQSRPGSPETRSA
jgi:hypothetical protein